MSGWKIGKMDAVDMGLAGAVADFQSKRVRGFVLVPLSRVSRKKWAVWAAEKGGAFSPVAWRDVGALLRRRGWVIQLRSTGEILPLGISGQLPEDPLVHVPLEAPDP